MGEMAPISLYTALVLLVMFAKSRLVQVVELFASLLLLTLHDGLLTVLGHWASGRALSINVEIFAA